MINFFRKVRKKLLTENRFSRYLIYALGEIILVVIGILIALQINNRNENRKIRAKELVYLENIKNDLQLTSQILDEFIATRKEQVSAANRTLEHYNGKPVTNWNAFNMDIVSIYTWQRFFPIDNTFRELQNSGNFAILSNDSIKKELLNFDVLLKKLKYNEDHFRYDAEVTLYEPSYGMSDLDVMAKNFIYQISKGNAGELGNMNEQLFAEMLKDIRQKNGFVFASLEFSGMISRFELMKQQCESINKLIEKELNN